MTLNVAAHPNSHGHRIRAAANLWIWQVWRRTVKSPVLVSLECGAKLRCPAWSKMAGTWVSIGYHEEELVFLRETIAPEDLFVDVGANIGVYSMVAAARGARVVAFEPFPQAREAFLENVTLNGCADRVTVHPCALSDERSTMTLTTDLESSNHLVVGAGSGLTVDVRLLDEVLSNDALSGRRVAIVKVDAEGFDANVLRGARRILTEQKPCVIVEVWAGGREVREILEPLGYAIYHFDATRRELEFVPSDFSSEGYFVAIHAESIDRIRERLRSSPTRRAAPAVTWRT